MARQAVLVERQFPARLIGFLDQPSRRSQSLQASLPAPDPKRIIDVQPRHQAELVDLHLRCERAAHRGGHDGTLA